jgi:hypothetical protein
VDSQLYTDGVQATAFGELNGSIYHAVVGYTTTAVLAEDKAGRSDQLSKHGMPLREHGMPLCEHGMPSCEHGLPVCEHGLPVCEHGMPLCEHREEAGLAEIQGRVKIWTAQQTWAVVFKIS